MRRAYFLLLLVFYPFSSLASSYNNSDAFNHNHYLDGDCRLRVPWSVMNHWEATGTPLSIFVHLMVVSVRDVPDSGGSFGVDIL